MTRKHWLRAAVALLFVTQALLFGSAFTGVWLAGMGAPGPWGGKPEWGMMALHFALASMFIGPALFVAFSELLEVE